MLIEEFADIVATQVCGRRDDVTGLLVAQLDDVFAQVGFDHTMTGGFERVIEFDLF